ncbi:MAG TPA: hypothetical protein VFL83_08895 [Anaeromyxobacter sp.]|nr:hypothetical protein [Anaeromyxobacter sp.]
MKTKLALLAALASLGGTASAQPVPANTYECSGDGVTVRYSTTSFTGEPRITYELRGTATSAGAADVGATISRAGDEIHAQDTVLGSLVTIVLDAVPDLFTDTLTLIAPAANLTERLPEVRFATTLFRTHTRTTIGGPALVEGLVQRSSSQLLVCVATVVYF